jgi:hypothetical protein
VPDVTDVDRGLPPGRYGEPRRLPRWLLAVLVVLGVAALVPVARTVLDRAAPDVRGTLTGFAVVDDHQVRGTVDVDKHAGATAVCTVQARNLYSDVVGTAEFVLAGPVRSGVVTKTFPTSDKAVIVEVTGCTTRTGG